MAYLPGFEHDIFISYVHDNNQDGWVTRLRHDLQKELSEYCRQELEWFHGKAQNEPYGLSVNSQ
jgi:hypothetical protein